MPYDRSSVTRRIFAAAAALVLSLTGAPASSQAQEGSEWRRYTSPEYGLTLSMPHHLVVNDDEENEAGAIKLRGDAALYLNVSPLEDESLEAFVRRAVLPGIDVTYRRRKGDWFAYSGYAGDEIVYGRTVLSCGGRYAHSFVITYPSTLRRTYDPVVTRLSHSLRPDPEFEARNC